MAEQGFDYVALMFVEEGDSIESLEFVMEFSKQDSTKKFGVIRNTYGGVKGSYRSLWFPLTEAQFYAGLAKYKTACNTHLSRNDYDECLEIDSIVWTWIPSWPIY